MSARSATFRSGRPLCQSAEEIPAPRSRKSSSASLKPSLVFSSMRAADARCRRLLTREEIAIGLILTAADASAELMHL